MNLKNKEDLIITLTEIVELEKEFGCTLNPLTAAILLAPDVPNLWKLENGVHAYWEVDMPDESTEHFSMDYFLGDSLSVTAWTIEIGKSTCRLVEENATPERAVDLLEQWFSVIFSEELKQYEIDNGHQ